MINCSLAWFIGLKKSRYQVFHGFAADNSGKVNMTSESYSVTYLRVVEV